MECNIGKTERRIRVGVGLLFLGIASFAILPEWGLILGLVLGAIGVATGVVGHCPLWKIFGVNTSDHTHVEHH
jgi:hypothetical protein